LWGKRWARVGGGVVWWVFVVYRLWGGAKRGVGWGVYGGGELSTKGRGTLNGGTWVGGGVGFL